MTTEERRTWSGLFRELGESVLELIRAELGALAQDLGRSGRGLALALALFAAGGALLFWCLGVFTAALVVLASRWLPWLAATLLVTGLWLVAALAVLLVGWLRLRRWREVDAPHLAVERRFRDHLHWWDQRVLPMPAGEDADQDGDEGEEEVP